MDVASKSKLSDLPVAESALLELCRPFAPGVGGGFAPQCEVVQPDEIPFPQDQLLVHHEHMTVELQRHHGSPVDVHVLDEHLDGDFYTRKIKLTPRDAGEKVVEWGIVRLDFRYMDRAVREEILAKKLPLGAILIKHDVLRRIKPRYFLRFPADGPVLKLFRERDGNAGSAGEPAYGRIGTIYCNEEPAIELLEIVVNCERDAR